MSIHIATPQDLCSIITIPLLEGLVDKKLDLDLPKSTCILFDNRDRWGDMRFGEKIYDLSNGDINDVFVPLSNTLYDRFEPTEFGWNMLEILAKNYNSSLIILRNNLPDELDRCQWYDYIDLSHHFLNYKRQIHLAFCKSQIRELMNSDFDVNLSSYSHYDLFG